MSQMATLETLESLLETFLDRAVTLKEKRLKVVEGISRLDEIAAQSHSTPEIASRVGEWFAENNRLLDQQALKPTDIDRIATVLSQIESELESNDPSPEMAKIKSEIIRWQQFKPKAGEKIVLHRGPEEATQQLVRERDTINEFAAYMEQLTARMADFAGGKKHLLSVLDDALKSSILQKSKDSLILSAFIIYYLKIFGYKVEPYVARLKHAESLIKEG